MSKHNRTCKVCQQNYRYCTNCYEDRLLPTWMIMFHSQDCKDVFQICWDVGEKKVDKDEAATLLSQLNLDYIDNFEKDIKAQVKELLGRSKPKKTTNKEQVLKVDNASQMEVQTKEQKSTGLNSFITKKQKKKK